MPTEITLKGGVRVDKSIDSVTGQEIRWFVVMPDDATIIKVPLDPIAAATISRALSPRAFDEPDPTKPKGLVVVPGS